jgi:tetratricopeptide (TPR) repeat protein
MSRRRDFIVACTLALLVAAVYAPIVDFGFVGYDDDAYVVSNSMVQQGLTTRGLRWALTSNAPANWHPFTLASHMLDVELFGLEAGGHHAVSAGLHLLNSLLVFFVLRSLTAATWRSAFVAALFAVHPLHVEVVAWVSQRKTLLAFLFAWLSVASYVGWTRRGGRARFALCGGAMVLSLASKPMFVTLPALLLLLDFWPLGRLSSRAELIPRLREKWVLVVLAVAAIGAALSTQSDYEAIAPFSAATLVTENLPNALLGYGWYVAKVVWPSSLAVHYPHPFLASVGGTPPSALHIIAATLLISLITGAALLRARSSGWLTLGWLWYAVALVPVAGFLQVGSQAVADRYAYGPALGLFVIVAFGLEALRERLGVSPRVAAAVAIASVAALAASAAQQVGYWGSSRALYARAVEVSPRDTTMLFNLGNALLSDGERAQAEERYRSALAVHPWHTPAQLNLAEMLREDGELDESIALYRKVLLRRPDSKRAGDGLRAALRAQSEQS